MTFKEGTGAWRTTFSQPPIEIHLGGDASGPFPANTEMAAACEAQLANVVVEARKYIAKYVVASGGVSGEPEIVAIEFGLTNYGEHREFLEFDIDQHAELAACAADHGVVYSTSVWDMPSAKAVVALAPRFVKVPSATNQHTELLELLCAEFGGIIHLSLGMTTRAEEERIVALFRERGRLADLVLYACTSGYPVPFEDVCLLEVQRLREAYGADVHAVGFSGHHLGIAADVAALALGAQYVERHFTLDRTSKGTDHAASLEPDGMRKLARDLRNVAKALTYKPSDVLPIEETQREKLKWRG